MTRVVNREWITFFPSTGNIYCFACKLCLLRSHPFVAGYSNWKHPEWIVEHVRSVGHLACMIALLHRWTTAAAIVVTV